MRLSVCVNAMQSIFKSIFLKESQMLHDAEYVIVKGQKAIRGAHKSLTKQGTLKRMKLTQLC